MRVRGLCEGSVHSQDTRYVCPASRTPGCVHLQGKFSKTQEAIIYFRAQSQLQTPRPRGRAASRRPCRGVKRAPEFPRSGKENTRRTWVTTLPSQPPRGTCDTDWGSCQCSVHKGATCTSCHRGHSVSSPLYRGGDPGRGWLGRARGQMANTSAAEVGLRVRGVIKDTWGQVV